MEKEHDQYLRDSQRVEDRSATTNGVATPQQVGNVDFESLVGGGAPGTVKADTVIDANRSWDDDVWGSIFSNGQPSVCVPFSDSPPDHSLNYCQTPPLQSPTISPPPAPFQQQQNTQSLPSSPKHTVSSLGLASRARNNTGFAPSPASTSYNLSTQKSPIQSRPTFPPQQRSSLSTSVPLVPQAPNTTYSASMITTPSAAPNYNISLPPAAPMPSLATQAMHPMQPLFASSVAAPFNAPTFSSAPLMPSGPAMGMGMGSALTPSRPPQPTWPTNSGANPLSKTDWSDFDPLA